MTFCNMELASNLSTGKEAETMQQRTPSAFGGAAALLDRGVRDQLRLSWRLLRDERVSAFKFGLPALLAFYVLSPIDPIPDFLVGIGQMDDLGVVIAGILIAARVIPKMAPGHIVDEHLRAMDGTGRPVARPVHGNDDVIDARFNVRG